MEASYFKMSVLGLDLHVFWLWITGCRISSVQSLSCVQLLVTPWTAAPQASLSITNSQSLLKVMSIELATPSNHIILCHPLLLPPSIIPCIRVFSNESVLCIRWSNYWSFSFSIRSSNEYSGLISFRTDWLDLLAVQGTGRVFSNTTVQEHRIFALSFLCCPTLTFICDYWKHDSFDFSSVRSLSCIWHL